MAYTNSGLTERKKLVWAGLKRPQQETSTVGRLVQAAEDAGIAYEDMATAVADDLTTFDEYETWLADNGLSTDDASELRKEAEREYETWADFESFVGSANSWRAFENGFGTTATFGGDAVDVEGRDLAAIKIHDDGGISRNGEILEEGTVEVIGRRIEFSESDPPRAEDGDIQYDNLSISPSAPTIGVTVTIEATVTNTNSNARTVTVTLTADGEAVDDDLYELDAGESRTVSFEYTSEEEQCIWFAIGDTDEEVVCWGHTTSPAGGYTPP